MLTSVGPSVPILAASAKTTSRIDGLDLARFVAMVAMLIAHYGGPGRGPAPLRGLYHFVDGRAMPLFVILGGAGITLLTARSAHPDRTLVARGFVLAALGLLLNEHVPYVAVIIYYYAAYYWAGVVLRRLSDWLLLAVAAAVTVTASLTYQLFAPTLEVFEGWGEGVAVRPWPLVTELTVAGYYPLLPSLAFVCVGMWLARQRLGQRRTKIMLAVVGIGLYGVGYGAGAAADVLVDPPGVVVDSRGRASLGPEVAANLQDFGIQQRQVERSAARTAAETGISPRDALQAELDALPNWYLEPEGFTPRRLLDGSGHSQMPAWVLGATGFALLVIGAACALPSMMARWRAPTWGLNWLAGLGRFSLTFYVVHTLVLRLVSEDFYEQPLLESYLMMTVVLGTFIAAASLWQLKFRHGPFEALVRVADGRWLSRRRSL